LTLKIANFKYTVKRPH